MYNSLSIKEGQTCGQNSVLWMAPDLVMGLSPEHVMVDYYDDEAFAFDSELNEEYLSFVRTAELGMDGAKYMVTQYRITLNTLSVQLKRTSWSYCQFVWRNQFLGKHVENGKHSLFYPNSFCLHLVIETSDGNLLVTETSRAKTNDYPSQKSVTLGEQIELSDFIDKNGYRQDMVNEWTKRAVFEEFGISKLRFGELFDETSLKVLSLDMEQDIYNFALVCTIKMRQDYEKFKKDVETTLDKNEISNIIKLPLENVPNILMSYPANKTEYHPSAFLQMLLFYIHKNGWTRVAKKEKRKEFF